MTKCSYWKGCENEATGTLTDCCDNYMGITVCNEHYDWLMCPCCDTEWEPLP